MMFRAEEDYLKIIYELQVEMDKQLIKTSEIKDSLGFSDQTINDMLKKLSNKKFINFIPYKGVSLTKKGINEAIKFVRAHRIWEVFLSNHLNYPWHLVHEEAEKLEHSSSLKMIDKLYDFLGKPKFCSHGNPIPENNFDIVLVNDIPLSNIKEKHSIMITRVLDDKDLLKLLSSLNIKLNSVISILNKDLNNEFISVLINDQEVVLPLSIGNKIFGKVV